MNRQARLRSAALSLGLDAPDGAHISGGEPALLRDPARGFRSFGEFGQVVRASTFGRQDDRLTISAAAATTYGNESTGADGGFAVPPQFAADVTRLVAEESLLPLFNPMPTGSNAAAFPKDETVPWGAVGVRAQWLSEGVAATQTKPVLGLAEMRMSKLACFVPVTDELMADSALLEIGRAHV